MVCTLVHRKEHGKEMTTAGENVHTVNGDYKVNIVDIMKTHAGGLQRDAFDNGGQHPSGVHPQTAYKPRKQSSHNQ